MVNRKGIFTLSEGKGLAALGLKPGEIVGQSVYEIYRDFPDVQMKGRMTIESISCCFKVNNHQGHKDQMNPSLHR